jgi:hypothetical protein
MTAAACLLSVPELRARNHTVSARTQLRDATVRTVRIVLTFTTISEI